MLRENEQMSPSEKSRLEGMKRREEKKKRREKLNSLKLEFRARFFFFFPSRAFLTFLHLLLLPLSLSPSVPPTTFTGFI